MPTPAANTPAANTPAANTPPTSAPAARAAAARAVAPATALRQLACAVALTLPVAVAQAQSVAEPTRELAPVTVTATATEVDVRDAPASVSIVTAEDIRKLPASDLNEVLRRVPGLSQGTTPDGGTSVQIRGLPQRYTLVLIDGQRTGSSGDTFDRYSRNEVNWVPIEAIERIEVIRGPMSSLYGSDAMGGVINIITRKTGQRWAGTVTAGLELDQDAGRGNDYTGSFSVGGPLGEGLKLRVNGQQTYRQADSSLPASANGAFRWGGGREGSKLRSAGARLDWDLNPAHRLSLDYQRGEWQTLPAPEGDASNPGGFTASRSTRGPRRMDREQIGLLYAGQHGFGTSKFSVNRIEYRNETTAPVVRNGQVVRDATHDTEAVATDLIVDGSLSLPFRFGFDQILTVGGQWQSSALDNPNSVGSVANADGVAGLSYKKVNAAALFAEQQLYLRDNLSLTLGARADHHDDYGTHVSPRAYVVYHPAASWTVRGGYSEGFRAPSLRESNPNFVSVSRGAGCADGYQGGGCNTRGNADLKPERTQSWELGTSWAQDARQAGLTFFHTDFKDKIHTRGLGYLNGSTFWQAYYNVAEAVTRGLEASVVLPLVDGPGRPGVQALTWRASATRMLKAENKATGEPLTAVPKWSASSGLDWQISDSLSASVQAELIGKQIHLDWRVANQANNSGVQRIQNSYVVYDLGLTYRLARQLRVNGGIRNLFDRNPNGDVDHGNNFYTPGRRFFASLSASF